MVNSIWNKIGGFLGLSNPRIGLNYSNGMRTPFKEGQTYTFGNDNWLYNNGALTEYLGEGVAGPVRKFSPEDLMGSVGTDAAGNKFTLGQLGDQGGGFTAGNVLGGLSGLLQGAGGLLSAYTGLKSLEMAKDQFGFQRALANRNLANQAKIINNTYDNAAVVSANLVGGGMDSAGRVSDTDAATRSRIVEEGKKKHVDGSPI